MHVEGEQGRRSSKTSEGVECSRSEKLREAAESLTPNQA